MGSCKESSSDSRIPTAQMKESDQKIFSSGCGLLNWRPASLQRFVTYKYYVLVFMLISIAQSMVFSYLTVVLSTIEKQFGLKSKEAAWVYSGNEISQICFIVFLPFVGRVNKKPFIMGIASMIAALGIFCMSLPYFAGRGKELIADVISTSHNDTHENKDLCLTQQTADLNQCNINGTQEKHYKDWLSMAIIFVGIFVVGIGSTGLYSFGVPFLDDNAGKENSPMALGYAMTSRIVGPTIGYALGAAILSIFVYPNEKPRGLNEDNPQWIGAWWLGLVIISVILMLLSPLMTLFPSKIPQPKSVTTDAETVIRELEKDGSPSGARGWWMEFLLVGKRLGTNPIYMCNLFAGVFVVLSQVGFYTFLPKYFEFAFRQKASTAAVAGGAANCLASAIGLIAAGYIIKRWQPSARWLAAWMIATNILGVIGSLLLMVIGCPSLDIHGMTSVYTNAAETNLLSNNTISCSAGCGCGKQRFAPTCSADGSTTFFSPCHAGCSNLMDISTHELLNSTLNKSLKIYNSCSCVKNNMKTIQTLEDNRQLWWSDQGAKHESITLVPKSKKSSFLSNVAVEGYCPSNCQQQFTLLVFVGVMLGSASATGLLPSTLINMRAIRSIDKSASMTLTVSVLSAFAILPSPMIFGAIYDNSCTIWGEKCGETLNCVVYDTDKLRTSTALLMASLMSMAVIANFGAWYLVKGLKIYDDESDKEKTTPQKQSFNDIT